MKRNLAALLWIGLLLGAGHLYSGPTKNTSILIRPAPGQMTIDGSNADWPKNSAITICPEYDFEAVRRMSLHNISLCYDERYLYLFADCNDASPMVNTTDPNVNPNKGWAGGDCLQMRLYTDIACVADMWYYSKKKQDALTFFYMCDEKGRIRPPKKWIHDYQGVDLQQSDCQLVHTPKKDKTQGYYIEARIPWREISRNNYQPETGEFMRIGFTVTFSSKSKSRLTKMADLMGPSMANRSSWGGYYRPNELFPAKFYAHYENWGYAHFVNSKVALPPSFEDYVSAAEKEQELATITMKAQQPGFYSIGLIDQYDVLRNIVMHQELSKGTHTLKWDGLDHKGKPIAAGRYRYKGLVHNGIQNKEFYHYGTSGNSPYLSDDPTSGWGGERNNPKTIFNYNDHMFIGWAGSESSHAIIRTDQSGRKQQGYAFHAILQDYITLTCGDQYIYYCASDCGVDLTSFKKEHRNAMRNKPYHYENVFKFEPDKIRRIHIKTGKIESFGDPEKQYRIPNHTNKEAVLLYKLIQEDRLGAHWVGTPTHLSIKHNKDQSRFPVNLFQLRYDREHLYASLYLSGKIVKLDPETLALKQAWDVPKAAGMDIDEKGRVWVLSKNRLLRLSKDKNEIDATIGRSSLISPVSLCIGPDNRFYVTDWSRQRMQVVVLNQQGDIVHTIGKKGGRNWIGDYDQDGMLLPLGMAFDARGRLWVCEDDYSPKRISLWDVKSGKPVKSLYGPAPYGSPGGMVDPANMYRAYGLNMEWQIDPETREATPLRTVTRRMHEKEYFHASGEQVFDGQINIIYKHGKRWIVNSCRRGLTILFEDDGEKWVPRNAAGNIFAYFWGCHYPLHPNDHPFPENIYHFPRDGHPLNKKHFYLWNDLNKNGLAEHHEFQFVPHSKMEASFKDASGWTPFIFNEDLCLTIGAKQESYIVAAEKGTNGLYMYHTNNIRKAPIRRPNNLRKDGHRFYSLDKGWDIKGNVKWIHPVETGFKHGAVGRTGSGLNLAMGRVDLDEQGSIFGINGDVLSLFTTDGLYVGRALKYHKYTTEFDATVNVEEAFFKGLSYNRKTERTFLVHGQCPYLVNEIVGLNDIKRIQGNITVSKDEAERVAARQQKTGNAARRKYPVYGIQKIDNPESIGWRHIDSIQIGEHKYQANIQVCYGKDSLYLRYDVIKKSAFENNSQNFQMAYANGDAVDLHLQTKWQSAVNRQDPAYGDLRILFTEYNNEPVAIKYHMKSQNRSPYTIRSGQRTITFNEISMIEDADVHIEKRTDGYRVRAIVPLASIGLETLAPGCVRRGDVGVIFANHGKRVARTYWANQGTWHIADVGIESELHPHKWGYFVFGK